MNRYTRTLFVLLFIAAGISGCATFASITGGAQTTVDLTTQLYIGPEPPLDGRGQVSPRILRERVTATQSELKKLADLKLAETATAAKAFAVPQANDSERDSPAKDLARVVGPYLERVDSARARTEDSMRRLAEVLDADIQAEKTTVEPHNLAWFQWINDTAEASFKDLNDEGLAINAKLPKLPDAPKPDGAAAAPHGQDAKPGLPLGTLQKAADYGKEVEVAMRMVQTGLNPVLLRNRAAVSLGSSLSQDLSDPRWKAILAMGEENDLWKPFIPKKIETTGDTDIVVAQSGINRFIIKAVSNDVTSLENAYRSITVRAIEMAAVVASASTGVPVKLPTLSGGANGAPPPVSTEPPSDSSTANRQRIANTAKKKANKDFKALVNELKALRDEASRQRAAASQASDDPAKLKELIDGLRSKVSPTPTPAPAAPQSGGQT